MCIATDEFDVLWVEIKNKKGKNFLIGCAYHHSNTDSLNFIEYIELWPKSTKIIMRYFLWEISTLIY